MATDDRELESACGGDVDPAPRDGSGVDGLDAVGSDRRYYEEDPEPATGADLLELDVHHMTRTNITHLFDGPWREFDPLPEPPPCP